MKLNFSNLPLAIILLTSLVNTKLVYAQNYTQSRAFRNANAHWFIRNSDDKMFDMRTTPPVATALPGIYGEWIGESGSGISDATTGDLLFYSDGNSVYNRNHQVMPNGANLLPPNRTYGWMSQASSYQQLCIVPVIDTPNKFHVFSVTPQEDPTGLYYWVVDMKLDNGMGDVEIGRKNIQLYDSPLLEAITAVPGNNCDVWVLAHPYHDSVFLAYHITAAGLDRVPVVSSPGANFFNRRNKAFEVGGIAVSPKRDKIALSTFHPENQSKGRSGWAEIMVAKFDPETGKVTDGIEVDSLTISMGVIFSTDGSKLYAGGELLNASMTGSEEFALLQYDVSKKTQAEIVASKNKISALKEEGVLGFRRLGDTIILTDYTYIPSPNQYGVQSGYKNTLNYFDPEQPVPWAISWGNDAVLPIYNQIRNTKETSICKGTTLQLVADPGYRSYRWNDGTKEPVLSISGEGTYWVEYETSCTTGVDTYHVRNSVLPAPDITVDERDLSTLEEYDTYQWILDGTDIAGATSRVHTAIVNGDYQVKVSRDSCTSVSDIYKVTNANSIRELTDGYKIRIHPNPASAVIYVEYTSPVYVSIVGMEGKMYKKEYNVHQVDIRDLADGLYLIQVRSLDGKLLKTDRFTKVNTP